MTSPRAPTHTVLLGAVIAILGIAIGYTRPWRGLEEHAQGLLLSARPPRAWNPQVVVIEVDDQTLKQLGWPVPRKDLAQVVAAAAGSGAKVAAFDIPFSDPSRDPAEDLAFSTVASDWGQVVLPVECIQAVAEGDPLPTSLAKIGATPAHHCSTINLPAGKLKDVVTLAHVESARGTSLWIESRGRRLPALALAAFARAEDIAPADIQQEPRAVSVGAHRFAVNFKGVAIASPRELPIENRRSLLWLLAEMKKAPVDAVPQSIAELFKDKHVVVGQTAAALGEHRVLRQGSLLGDLIEGTTMREASPGFTALLVLALVAIAMGLGLGLRPTIAIVFAAVLLGGFVLGCTWAAGQGALVSPVAPLFTAGIAFAVAVAMRQRIQGHERQALHNAFAGDVDPAVLARVLDEPDRYLALGGAKKTLTILFTDITGYAQDLTADHVLPLLREYVTAMTDVVKKHEGRVDKTMGDGVLAVFGDPMPHDDHAQRAVTAGMQMLEEVARLQQQWTQQGRKGIAIRIGVATGEVLVGNLGSDASRIDYRVLGPTVTLASRLEGKAPAGSMLVSEATYQACRARYSFHAIGGLELKGFTDTYKAWLFVGSGLEGDPERIAPRLPTLAEVLVTMGGMTVKGTVENVSAGGLYVIAEGRAVMGDLIELEFPASSHLAAPVTVRAEVRHVTQREDGQQGFGVKIERADAAHGDDLRHFVALYLGPQPDGSRVDSGGESFRLELGEAYGRLIKEKPP